MCVADPAGTLLFSSDGALYPADPQRAFLEMGRGSADVNLQGPQRGFLRQGSPHGLLSFAETIYAYYCSWE